VVVRGRGKQGGMGGLAVEGAGGYRGGGGGRGGSAAVGGVDLGFWRGE